MTSQSIFNTETSWEDTFQLLDVKNFNIDMDEFEFQAFDTCFDFSQINLVSVSSNSSTNLNEFDTSFNYQVSPTKLEIRRAKNRASAATSRKRSRDRVNRLAETVKELRRQNEILENTNTTLRNQNVILRQHQNYINSFMYTNVMPRNH